MVYGYIRISTDKQSVENQRFEILKYANKEGLHIDQWVEETVSGTKRASERLLGAILKEAKKNDVIIMTELSRLGRSLVEIMAILQSCIEGKITIHSIKEGFKLLENDIPSSVMAFAFSLAAQIERQLISQRTKEALNRKKHEGQKLGRPKGSSNKETKLTGKEEQIKELLNKKVSVSAIARVFAVNRATLSKFIEKHKLY